MKHLFSNFQLYVLIMEIPRHMKKYPNNFVILPFWMSELVTELPNKIENKLNKYVIVK